MLHASFHSTLGVTESGLLRFCSWSCVAYYSLTSEMRSILGVAHSSNLYTYILYLPRVVGPIVLEYQTPAYSSLRARQLLLSAFNFPAAISSPISTARRAQEPLTRGRNPGERCHKPFSTLSRRYPVVISPQSYQLSGQPVARGPVARSSHNSSPQPQKHIFIPHLPSVSVPHTTTAISLLHCNNMPRAIENDSDFISAAAARTRDLKAAALLLDLRLSDQTESEPPRIQKKRVAEENQGDASEAVEMKGEGSSQPGEQRDHLSPTSKPNAGHKAGRGLSTPTRLPMKNTRSTKENTSTQNERIPEQTTEQDAGAPLVEGHEPRRSTRLQEKAMKKAETAGTSLTTKAQSTCHASSYSMRIRHSRSSKQLPSGLAQVNRANAWHKRDRRPRKLLSERPYSSATKRPFALVGHVVHGLLIGREPPSRALSQTAALLVLL